MLNKDKLKDLKAQQDRIRKNSPWTPKQIATLEECIKNGIHHRDVLKQVINRPPGGILKKVCEYKLDPKWAKYFNIP